MSVAPDARRKSPPPKSKAASSDALTAIQTTVVIASLSLESRGATFQS